MARAHGVAIFAGEQQETTEHDNDWEQITTLYAFDDSAESDGEDGYRKDSSGRDKGRSPDGFSGIYVVNSQRGEAEIEIRFEASNPPGSRDERPSIPPFTAPTAPRATASVVDSPRRPNAVRSATKGWRSRSAGEHQPSSLAADSTRVTDICALIVGASDAGERVVVIGRRRNRRGEGADAWGRNGVQWC